MPIFIIYLLDEIIAQIFDQIHNIWIIDILLINVIICYKLA